MMNLARRYGVLSAFAVLMLGAMGRADANSITYTVPLSTGTQPGLVPLFNPNLGTLLEVDFTATGSGSAMIEFLNATSVSGSYVQIESFVFVGTSPNGNLNVGPFFGNGTPFSTTTGLVPLSGNFNISAVLGPSSFFISDGDGNVFNLQTVQTFQVEPNPQVQFSLDDNVAGGTATVTYVFSVPEPSSVVPAGIGLASAVGLGYWRRRRRRVAP